MWGTALCLLIPLAALAAGCGGASDSVSEVQLAKAISLQPRDLPGEWESSPVTHGRACPFSPLPVRTFQKHMTAGLLDIQQRVMVFKSIKDARRAFGELTSTAGSSCFRKIVEEEVLSQSGGPILKKLDVSSRSKEPHGQSKQMVMTVQSPIGAVNVYTDDLKSHAGSVVTTLRLSSGLLRFPDSTYRKIRKLTERRLRLLEEKAA